MRLRKEFVLGLSEGFAPFIIIVIVTLVIGVGVGGFLILQKKEGGAPPQKTSLPKTETTIPSTIPLADENPIRPTEPPPPLKIPSVTSPTLPKIQPALTFIVTIPENTPEDDKVWIYIGQTPLKMEKMDTYTHRLTINETELSEALHAKIHPGTSVRYRYSRNGYDFKTAEYLEPNAKEPNRDTNDYFWTKQGREIAYAHGKIQNDTITRWRWFPETGIPLGSTNLQPDRNFLPRIGNISFRSGQTIEDLYVPAFHDFFDSTARHVKKMGYTWVELDPPWQWTQENGLPKVFNDTKNAPNYPDAGTFLEELRAYKREGLKVLIAPQICCTSLDTADKPKEWWDAYFDETERFLTHFAKLAEQGGGDAFSYAISSWDAYPAHVDLDKKWRAIFKNIRNIFTGELGEMLWILGPEVSVSPQLIPDTAFVTWGDALDFFLVATEFPLSTKDNPSDEDLEKGAKSVVEGVKMFYDKFQKPIMMRNGYFNVKYSWKGQSFYSIGSIPWISDPESSLKQSTYEFNTEDHARTVHAMFKAIAEKPWITGYFHFGYTHWEDPLSPWMSIRGKPAEDIWNKWNTFIYK